MLSPTPLPGGDKDMDFDIEKTTGSIVIARPLDTRRRSSYNLTVEVTDGSQTIATPVRSLTGSPELRRDRRFPWLEVAVLTTMSPTHTGASLVGMRTQKALCAPQRRLNLESGFCIPVLSDHSLYVCDLGRILVPTVDLCIIRSFI